MKKKRKKFKSQERLRILDIRTVFLSAMFLCGVCAGCVTATYITGDCANFLNEYLTKEVLVSVSDIRVKEFFLKTLIALYKYPVVIFLFGYTAFGIVFIPAVLTLRGYFISFCVTSVVRGLGYKGLLTALSLYGLQAVLSIPCVLIIATKAMRASQGFLALAREGQERRLTSPIPEGYFACFLICIACLTVCAALEVLLVPKLSAWSYALIF